MQTSDASDGSDIVRFYVPSSLAEQVKKGELTFYSKLCNVLHHSGFTTEFCPDDPQERRRAKQRDGYSISLMQSPINERGVTIRRNYFYPFWNVQSSAERWHWPVAKATFDPAEIAPKEASIFANYWRKALYNGAADAPTKDGFVYAPLQGRLTAHRSFQSCSPIEMLEHILEHDPERPVITTRHPKGSYTRSDIAALERLERKHPRLTVETSDMITLLRTCDYVATQNSAVALFGYFFHKPTALFSRIDFHHIASNAHDLGPRRAVQSAPHLEPEFDAYLCWFFKHMSINAELPTAEDKIAAALRNAGWPIA